MKLAKPRIDIGFPTNNVQPLLDFWQKEIGLPFDHLLPIRKGQKQHRHDLLGSVLKINELADPIPDRPRVRLSRTADRARGLVSAEAAERSGRQSRDAGAEGHARHRAHRHPPCGA